MPRSRRAIVVAVIVALVAAGAVVAVVATHHGKGRATATTPNQTSASSTPSSEVNTAPIAGLAADKFGISPGVQLFRESVDKIDADMAGYAALPTRWLRAGVRWDLIEPKSPNRDDWTKVKTGGTPQRILGVRLVLSHDVPGTPPLDARGRPLPPGAYS